MHHLSSVQTTRQMTLQKALKSSIAFLLLATSLQAKADPIESAQKQLTRTQASGMLLQTNLVKNAYRSESYQDTENYTVDVPYQDTETYYENVPYQDTETYTDYETQYSNEYVCHDYTNYERQCHTERNCGWGPRPPGVGPAPYPEPPTPIRPEPPSPIRPDPQPPVCRDQEVCVDVPVTSQQCGYEQVAHTVPVTRTREVTRYRQEQRTREVTRYRQEQRTREVTRYRQVYDHQWNLNVAVQFPADAVLAAGEQEILQVTLSGEESAPSVSFATVNSIYGYLVVNQGLVNGQYLIVLQTAPKNMADLQDDRRISATILGSGATSQLNLVDQTINYASVATKYVVSLVIKNTSGKSVVLSEKSLSRAALKAQADGSYLVAISDLGMSAANIAQYIKSGVKINVVVEVDRVDSTGQKIQFWKDNVQTIK